MPALRRLHGVLGPSREIAAGLVLFAALVVTTAVVSASTHHSHLVTALHAPEAGGGAFVPATSSTTTSTAPSTTTTTVPPTTTTTPPAPSTTEPPRSAPAAPPPTTPAPPPARISAAVGVYTGAANPSGAASFAQATGAHVTVVEDYLPGSTWNVIDGSNGALSWMLDAWQGSGYQLVLGVPMFDNSGTDSLAVGATGAYNPYFTTLAQTLVAAGQGNAILRLGQEFTGSWNPWRVTDTTDAANYAEYYRQIVTAMRSVDPGLRFIWEGADPQDGSYSGAYTADDSYPGDAYVNYIGADTYDQSWAGGCGIPFNNTSTPAESSCSWSTNTLPGLTRVADFAFAHGKPVVFPEWGLAVRGDGHGMGDDPTFIGAMASWMATHSVAFAIYFNFDVSGQVDAITDGSFPASLAAYRFDFG
ncbi:MAG: glycosyl hydrolase, partial [Acidimicrobiales bacterium]